MLANYRETGEWARRRKRERERERRAPFSSEITQNKRRKNTRWLQQYITLGANKYTSRVTFRLVLRFWQVPLLITILTPQCTNEYKKWIQICKQKSIHLNSIKLECLRWSLIRKLCRRDKERRRFSAETFLSLIWNVMDNHNVYYSIHTQYQLNGKNRKTSTYTDLGVLTVPCQQPCWHFCA